MSGVFEWNLDSEGRRGGGVRRGLDRVRPLAQHNAGGRNRTVDPGPERTAALSELRALGERGRHARLEERP
jgi:hypothetical protein